MKKSFYEVPDKKKIRVIIDSDTACECDDQYAIVHALLSEKVDVCGMIAEHFGSQMCDTMNMSYLEQEKLCNMMQISTSRIHRGVEHALSDEETGLEAEGVDFLIEEAGNEDARPLFVICQGAVSNIASAILKAPEICKRMQLIMVAGINYPSGGYEFNTMNDYHAFNVVMNSEVPVWAVPEEVYGTMQTSFYELMEKVHPYGELGKYLVENTFEVSKRMTEIVPREQAQSEYEYEYALAFPNGESWSLGDSVGIGILLSAKAGNYSLVDAPNVHEDGSYFYKHNAKKIRWYDTINQRFVLEDFFCKLKYQEM